VGHSCATSSPAHGGVARSERACAIARRTVSGLPREHVAMLRGSLDREASLVEHIACRAHPFWACHAGLDRVAERLEISAV